MAGRGWGKTRTGAEWLAEQARTHPGSHFAVVSRTTQDGRETCLEGLSGLLRALDLRIDSPEYNRTTGQISLSNGAVIYAYSSEKPERVRGPNLSGAWCVAAGVPVATERGDVPIEQIRVGDRVMTRHGWRRVLARQRTGVNVPTVEVRASDGSACRCTADHKVWANGAWRDARTLAHGDRLIMWISSSMDRQRGENGKDSAGTTRRRWDATEARRESCSPTRSGAGTTVRSRTVSRFITSTNSPPMTGLRTYSSSSFTRTVVSTLRRMARRLTPELRAQTQCGLSVNLSSGSAMSAARRTNHARPIQATAASGAVIEHATVVSVSDSGCSDVYDLTIEGAHEFFAGGILAHNCDELATWRYPDFWTEGLMPALRIGEPKVVVTTTPRRTSLLREFVSRDDGSVVITRGSTFDNEANLSLDALAELRRRYEGTRVGRQELMGELLEDVPGALWSAAVIENSRAVMV